MPKSSKERVFTVLLVLIPVFLLLALEMGLRLSGFAESRRSALKPIDGEPGWVGLNPEYPGRYFRGFLPAVAFTPFREVKPDNSVRVVVLGGSSTAGFPYQWYQGFPSGLERRLTDQYAGRPVEVINLGMTAVNSYTLWDLGRHVIDMDPDLVVIYAGHNEFYGAYGAGTTAAWYPKSAWFGRMLLTLKRSAIVMGIERILFGPPDYGLDADPNERTLMARVVQDAGIVLDEDVYSAGIAQFESNMERVLSSYQENGIPVVVGTLVANLSEQHPLSQTVDAVEAFEAGRQALQDGDVEEARIRFIEARDLDQIRFRASTDINDIIRSWSGRDGVSVVDLEPAFEEASTTGIPGYDLFTDHLHPTARGYDLIAEELTPSAVAALEQRGIRPRPLNLEWDSTILLDGLSESEAGILIDRLLSDYPFNLDDEPGAATSRYQELMDARRQSGSISDSLAISVMTTDMPTQNALLEGARLYESSGDSLQALQYYHSLFYWQPFNATLMEEVIGRYLTAPTWDAVTEKLALYGAARSDQLYFWNALAVTQIRQERWESAAVALQQAERLDDRSPVMLYNRARLELAQGDTLAARSTLEAYRSATQN